MIRYRLIFVGLVFFCGCHMSAPMHVWKQPRLDDDSLADAFLSHRGALCVAIAPVGGPPEIAQKINDSMMATRPQTIPNLAVLFPDQLEKNSGIQLVSFDGQPSEMAAFGAAKRSGAKFVLSGQILAHDLSPRQATNKVKRASFRRKKTPDESMSVRWTVFDAQSGSRLGESTIDMDTKKAVQDFPDLAYQGSPETIVIAACARRSWELLIPTTSATRATLDLPWLMPGSASVRKGNAYARLGQWEQAERQWQETADLHPWNLAAWHNLSMAAVAKEDFQLARDRLRHADPWWIPGDQTAKSSAWIDSVKNQYDACFDPANASFDPIQNSPQQLGEPEHSSKVSSEPAVAPRSLDDQPWYTMIPFIPPPGWSWSDWWYQSILF